MIPGKIALFVALIYADAEQKLKDIQKDREN
jgi:hypothetical protein